MAKRASTKKKSKNESTDNIQDDLTTREQNTSRDSSASRQKEEKLKQDGSYIVLPDINDIPGQEKIADAGVPGEMADITIASDDEEGLRDGKDILEEDNVDIVMGTEADVTKEDLAILGDPDQDMDLGEDELVKKEGLDDTDTDGDPLNEAAVDESSTGDDLDIPDADDDDPRKDPLGQDDEENNYYSLGGDKNDELNEGKKTE